MTEKKAMELFREHMTTTSNGLLVIDREAFKVIIRQVIREAKKHGGTVRIDWNK